jgi:hypothetical protein
MARRSARRLGAGTRAEEEESELWLEVLITLKGERQGRSSLRVGVGEVVDCWENSDFDFS